VGNTRRRRRAELCGDVVDHTLFISFNAQLVS
jgi:hypothetical protein